MEIWPTDDRTLGASSNSQRKGKGKKKASSPGYPCLEPGRLEAVTLVEKRGRFEWLSPVDRSSKVPVFPKLLARKSTPVYPATCSPSLSVPRIPIAQHAEQSARFLRKHLPYFEFTKELVREELARDAVVARKLAMYDPFAGNSLALSQAPGATNYPMFLAFPMGETCSDLNISCLTLSETGRIRFDPAAVPVKSFPTAIQQVVFSHSEGLNLMAIRTLGSTTLLESHFTSSSRKVQLKALGTITRDDVGQYPVVDIKFHLKPFDILAVNSQGSVYQCCFADGRKAERPLYSQGKTTDNFDQFWRLASIGTSEDGCLISSNKTVEELDFRAANTALRLLAIENDTEMLTCIEDTKDDYLVRLSSTEQILWLDRRFPGRAILGIKHHRQYDRTLGIRTLSIQNGLHTLLHSRKNSLITVYDVSRTGDYLLQVHEDPYLLPTNMPSSDRYVGDAVFSLNDQTTMFRLTERGGIDRLDLGTTGDMIDAQDLECSSDLQALDAHPEVSRSPLGPSGEREFSEADVRPIYDYIFQYSPEEVEAKEQEQAEAVYELLEHVPSFWRNLEAPVENILSLYDIVLRSGTEPEEISRNDFLTGSVFNSTRGYRSLAQGRFPTEALRKDASWHYNISPILSCLDASLPGDICTIAEYLREFDLSTEEDHPPQALRRQAKAREQLALDLALSTDLFSSRAISRSSGLAENNVDSAEPSQVDFCYLQPIPKRDYYSRDTQEEKMTNPLGVKLLLKDWDLGKDPEQYLYKDPYGDEEEPEQPAMRRLKAQSQPLAAASPVIAASENPPSVMASSSIFPATQVTFQQSRGSFSQGEGTQPVEKEPQTLMTSTQILPGPFGGRPVVAAGKRKGTKKRMGGF